MSKIRGEISVRLPEFFIVSLTGLLSCYVVLPAPGIVYPPDVDSPMDCYSKVLLVHLNSKSGVQRQVAGLLMAEWGRLSRLGGAGHEPDPLFGETGLTTATDLKCPPILSATLHQCLVENLYFDEIRESYTRLLQDTWDFIARLKHYKVPVPDYDSKSRVSCLNAVFYSLKRCFQTYLPSSERRFKKCCGFIPNLS